jgi:iron(III) transport system permease protein
VTLALSRARTGTRKARPGSLIAVSSLVAVVLALPLVFLLVEAHGAGVGDVRGLIFRSLTGQLLWNTVRLTVVVTALTAVIGTAAAWCVERTDLPGRRIWAVLVVVPLAIPDFVVSFGWNSLWTWVTGFKGAVVVMTLAVYPLVYLPVAASLRSADPGQEEVARSLGAGRVKTFVKITLGQAKGAIAGGCLLVALVMLAEYGAFEIIGYRTFTTEIFSEFDSYSFAASCALSLVLVVFSLVILAGEAAVRGGNARVARSGPMVQRQMPPHHLSRSRWPVLAGFAALVLLALGVPIASCIYWMVDGLPPELSGGANVSMLDAAWHTCFYSATAAALATLMAFPVAMLAVRHSGRLETFLERSTYLVLAMPGVVIAFALYYFTERYAGGFGGGTALLLIVAYAIMFFPLALVGVKASLARAPAGLEEMARSLGSNRLKTLARVTLRLTGPGLAAAFCLVFLSGVTELTATLLLIPSGTQTLATQFWQYEDVFSYSQAAPFALVMILVAALPSYVLGRFFDRTAHAQK